jgi:hypothetical protein
MIEHIGTLHTSELFSSWGADCPAIVPAEEDHWSFRDSSKVESSVEVSLYVFICQKGLATCFK